MPINTLCPKYRAGQRLCPICSDPLGAHQVWPGAKLRYCMKPECTDVIRMKKGGFFTGPDIIKCERPGCEAHLPEGRYANKAPYQVCSAGCWYAMAKASPKALPCGCECGEMVIRPCLRTSKSKLVFVDSSHLGHYRVQKNILESCGSFSPLASTYLDWAATSGQFAKSTIGEIRYAVCKLFLYMSESAVEDVRLVKPRHIFDFISWAARHEILNVGHSMTHLSTFFGWLHANELVDANPIVPRFHYPKKKARKPRPFSDADIQEVWKLLHERGTSKLWFAMALALEAGLRIGEVCNLRLEDVDIEGRRCFVRLPNKASKERHAHFHDLTAQYFDLWMS